MAHPDTTLAPSVQSAVVVADSLTRRYGEGESAVDALRGVSLEIPRGQFTAVMGPSGSGKSTLMHILAGLDLPTAGTVAIEGQEITSMDDGELTLLRRRKARTSAPEWESRLPVGSSANTTFGRVTSARAHATRCC